MADLSYTGVIPRTGPNTFSRRSVGYEWETESAENMSVLFGAGGEVDGTAFAIIGTTRNKQIEDAMTLQGMGVDGSMDQAGQYIPTANRNNEFNFSNFKTGAASSTEIKFNGSNEVYLNTTEDGLANGDTTITADPQSSQLDIQAANLGILFGDSFDENSAIMPNNGSAALADEKNPFIGYSTYSNEARMDEAADFYYGDPDNTLSGATNQRARANGYDGISSKVPVNLNEITGLRKINTKRNQGTLIESMVKKTDFMNMYQEQSRAEANAMEKEMGESMVSVDYRESLLENTRTNISSFIASQSGLQQISRNTAKRFKKGKGQKAAVQNMFSITPLGV